MAAVPVPFEVGTRWGSWTGLAEAPKRGRARYIYVRCDCGVESDVRFSALRQGRSWGCQSCGNRRRWQTMKARAAGEPGVRPPL